MVCHLPYPTDWNIVDNKLLLAKCITLLYKESLLPASEQTGRELVEEAIQKIQPREIGLSIGTEKDVVAALRATAVELLSTPHNHGVDRTGLLQRIRIDVGDNDKLYQAFEKGLQEQSATEDLHKTVQSYRRSIDRHLKDLRVSEVLTSAAASWNYRKEKIADTQQFLTSIWTQLEPLASLKTVTDPAIIDEVRISDQEQIKKIVTSIRTSIVENRVYKTGWQGLNRMLQGGIRPAEFWVTAALQHKYKTGFAQSIFNQIALYNKPMTTSLNKKPAMVVYAFEDVTTLRFQFIIQQLMFTATREHFEVSNFTVEEMQSFIYSKLTVNGFELFFYRIDPSKWSYSDLFRSIIELERQGYSIEFALFDYLEKLPTTGCVTSGPVGNDILDLFSRVRTFLNARGIAALTPHQLSAESKRLIRGAVTEDKFTQMLVGRGYYKGTSQLDQIPDGILLSHVFTHGPDTYLSIQRDRHRIPTIVPEKYKHFYLKFPKDLPIPDDINTDDSSLYKLPAYAGNADPSLFTF